MIKIKIKLNSYSNSLEEGRIDDLKKKYPGKDDLIDQFSKAPGNNKYLDWMMRHHEETSPEEMLKAIAKFDKYISQVKQKDINFYRNFESLQDVVEDLKPPKKELERTGTNDLYEDDEFSITRPTNKEAARKLGCQTKWCIAATKSKNYFNQYAKGGAYHYFLKIKNLPDDDPKHLIAYTLVESNKGTPSVEIYDAEDTLIDRRAVVYAIYSATPERPTPKPGDSNFLNFNLGPGDDDFESDYEDASSDEDEAQSKEEKLYQIMLSDFHQKVSSGSPGSEETF